jgi:endonuclease-8
VLLVAFDAGLVQISHNQLYGKWRVMPVRTLPGFETEHRRSIRVVIATAERAAVLLAATTLELVDARDVASHPLVARLGPDVLDRATTVALVRERYLSRPFARRAVATLLLDQRFLAGPGNYLRSEILHVAGVHPA